MAKQSYKKYMKKNINNKDYNLVKVFIISFFGMLLLFTFIIKSFLPSVDVSIGDYKQEQIENDVEKNVDNRLAMIQDEDRGRDFSELMKNANDIQKETENVEALSNMHKQKEVVPVETQKTQQQDPVYKVFIGSYTSSEQAKVAKDIIQESGANLNPIVKCIGSNNYTLQVGIFKNRSSAETLLYTIQQNNLPGRIVQEY